MSNVPTKPEWVARTSFTSTKDIDSIVKTIKKVFDNKRVDFIEKGPYKYDCTVYLNDRVSRFTCFIFTEHDKYTIEFQRGSGDVFVFYMYYYVLRFNLNEIADTVEREYNLESSYVPPIQPSPGTLSE